MAENVDQLIQRILDGDKEAFSSLVNKYQKRTHALAWKIIGDYQIAEEITQDTFVQVNKKLPTLRNPKQFDGWLYVITRRLCINWINRKKPEMLSLDQMTTEELEEILYRQYELELLNKKTIEHKQDIVNKLLSKLPESERTVVTLYYIGEMTPTEISKKLGVSVNTIKARLLRGQNRLREKGKSIINETVGSVQLSTDLTESIMNQIREIKPEPQITKPFLPWAALGASLVLVFLLFGAMNQYFTHLQQPYNFDALSEPTIEIVESPITVDVVTNTVERKRIGREVSENNNDGNSTQISETVINSDDQDNSIKFSTANWTPFKKPSGTEIFNFFTTSKDDLFATAGTGLYKLDYNTNSWININADVPIRSSISPLTEYKGVFFTINSSRIHTSIDQGKTWEEICSTPKGSVKGLIVQENPSVSNPEKGIVMYLASSKNGVFKSIDSGKQWLPMNEGLIDKRITAMESIDNTIFIGTYRGLYRLNSDYWELLPVHPNRKIESMAVFNNNLYIVTGADPASEKEYDRTRRIFHSHDFGTTLIEITPKNRFLSNRLSTNKYIQIAANKKSLYVYGTIVLRSMDQGKSWTELEPDLSAVIPEYPSIFSLDKDTYYKINMDGLHRSTDNGSTWHPFMNGILGVRVLDLVSFNNQLYASTGNSINQSINNGRGWETIPQKSQRYSATETQSTKQHINHLTESKFAIVNNVLYGITNYWDKLNIYRLVAHENQFSVFKRIPLSKLSKSPDGHSIMGGFTVTDDIFYIEFNHQLFKWKSGSSKITNTGLIDTTNYSNINSTEGLKVAASANTVFVGKRDGRLVRSIDRGNSWKDITSNLPYSVTYFKDITFVDNFLYVATDKGGLVSQTGKYWQNLTDNEGKRIIIDKFASHGTNIYGASQTGAYFLNDEGKWEQIHPNIPNKVISLSCGNEKLFILTDQQEIFYASLR
ncbi:sigma-70 family RNA polymerase sigma factor [Candidatus Poribacteria bacterium]|nr:sigma-70 family RNA polymerase sigma factor [Candidatus Poribacteria bacterium]